MFLKCIFHRAKTTCRPQSSSLAWERRFRKSDSYTFYTCAQPPLAQSCGWWPANHRPRCPTDRRWTWHPCPQSDPSHMCCWFALSPARLPSLQGDKKRDSFDPSPRSSPPLAIQAPTDSPPGHSLDSKRQEIITGLRNGNTCLTLLLRKPLAFLALKKVSVTINHDQFVALNSVTWQRACLC